VSTDPQGHRHYEAIVVRRNDGGRRFPGDAHCCRSSVTSPSSEDTGISKRCPRPNRPHAAT
jgi:hypothetical protein